MTERSKSYQDAVQILRSRLNNRWEGVEAEGRDEMVKILKHELGFERDQANDAIDAMIRSGVLRYHRPAAEAGEVPPPPVLPMPTGASGVAGVPIGTGLAGPGYWQIGPEESDEPGRAGQVRVGD
jgi:hypothetical protein